MRNSHFTTSEEEQLWKDFQSGNDTAFTQLYNEYFSLLYNYASKFTSDKELVKDCIHDLFIKIWEKRNTTEISNSLKYYLLKAMRNSTFDALEAKKKLVLEEGELTEDRFEFVLPHESLLIAQQLTEEQKAGVIKALNSLTPRQKEAIFLRFYNNLSYEEIAALMAVSVDSCYNLISKALGLVKKNLNKVGMSILFLFSLSYSNHLPAKQLV